MPEPITVSEIGKGSPYKLADAEAEALKASRLGLVKLAYASSGKWQVKGNNKVGSARIGGRDVHVAPKFPIRRVLFLLGYTEGLREPWQHDEVLLEEELGLVPAFAQPLWRQIDAALKPGLLYGYRERDEVSTVLRGRLRETDQLYRGHGLQTPLQIRYSDRTPDIPENQILKAAVLRMMSVPGVDAESRRRLRLLLAKLAKVTPTVGPLPTINRLNARYATALKLAELTLRQTSVDQGEGRRISCNGFVVDMEDVFENFVRITIGSRLKRMLGGRYDKPGIFLAPGLPMHPDLVWYRPGPVERAGVVVDAKYSQEKERGGGGLDDIRQMLVYCTVLGVRRGHLIYAKGNAAPTTFPIADTGIDIVCHSLNLNQDPESLFADIQSLANQIAAGVSLARLTS
ncbi:McrC family protein [Nonomuraea ceibae]|uniref:McrC family protein n=1 Tax=Nonomuraea ceibae TaxID=1935170 RepID=UPI001C5F6E63|nr:McrC family protein [Nonomuraea ceibae]